MRLPVHESGVTGLVALAPGLSLEFLVEERSEGPGVLCLHGVVVDKDFLEERLVEEPADAVWGVSIDGLTVADQLDAVVGLGFCLGMVGAGVVEAGVDACQHAPDAGLLVLELVQRDRSGVVGLEEFVPLRQEIAPLLGQVVDLHLRFGVEDGELFGDDGLE
ncbi:hypothetical protein E1262_00820 [Jiangella aurantiaca]|uniref:Uncharacterized protein n=1 Tax=Jiangella aurantiaca TaxID=2530373 RepID=A0A4R5ARP2_9ACTN|nr:hypothetical protein [Jiangella aurantiaca]TDD73062.1 hypothetical protein E1262_00820 [Jiangella aurantiaca]